MAHAHASYIMRMTQRVWLGMAPYVLPLYLLAYHGWCLVRKAAVGDEQVARVRAISVEAQRVEVLQDYTTPLQLILLWLTRKWLNFRLAWPERNTVDRAPSMFYEVTAVSRSGCRTSTVLVRKQQDLETALHLDTVRGSWQPMVLSAHVGQTDYTAHFKRYQSSFNEQAKVPADMVIRILAAVSGQQPATTTTTNDLALEVLALSGPGNSLAVHVFRGKDAVVLPLSHCDISSSSHSALT